MTAAGILTAGVGIAASFFGWWAAIWLFMRYFGSSMDHRTDLPAGSRLRALTLGGLLSVGVAVRASLTGADAASTFPVVLSLSLGFLLPALYSVGWMVLMAKVGQQDVLAGELGMVIAAIMMACLWVVGFLWITLILLGGLVLLSGSMVASFYISRCT